MKKVALITGAASGIGKATAFKFVEKGYRVAISDCDERAINVVGQQIIERGGEAIVKQCDISDPGQVASMIQDIVQEFGQLDVACNNA